MSICLKKEKEGNVSCRIFLFLFSFLKSGPVHTP
jgi:hypothetical protein